jgi:hypothetical protein
MLARMERMHTFIAVLVRPIEFIDRHGKVKTLKAGREIVVSSLDSLLCTDRAGVPSLSESADYIGSHGEDSFDIRIGEFVHTLPQ